MKNPILSLLKLGVPLAVSAAAFAAARFRAQHTAVKEQPHSEAPIITAMGDSITFGSGVAATRKTDTWEYKLEQLFTGAYQVLNYGISGATLQNEGDKPYWDMKEANLRGFPQAAMALKPEIVLLMLGTNDSKPYNWNHERYAAQLDQRVKELKADTRLILMVPPFSCPAGGSEVVAFDILNETIRDEIRPTVLDCAAENEVECIDLYALTENHPEYFADGVHPNSFGNQIIAKEIFRFLTK